MQRLLYFPLPIQGHLSPSLPVVRALADSGVSVDAFSTQAFAERLRSAGATVHAYPEDLTEHVESPSSNPIRVAALLARLTEHSLLELALDAVDELRPDAVLTDSMAPWGLLAARRRGVPVITSTSSFLVHPGLGATPSGAIDMLTSAAGSGRALAELTATRRRLRRAHQVDPGGPLRVLSNRGDCTVVYTSRALQPGGRRLRGNLRFVGPTLADPATADRSASAHDASDRHLLDAVGPGPLRYVSLGTIYNDRPAFLRACITALSGAGRPVVVATGHRIDPAELGPLGDDVFVVPFAPQLALLERAELFVTHGGMNSVSEALWHGVPTLAFPQAADQPVVAARIAHLGAGRVLRGREPGAGQIRRKADLLLSGGSATESATALGDGLRQAGGAGAAVEAIRRTVRDAQAARSS